jgi:hypothetical protein
MNAYLARGLIVAINLGLIGATSFMGYSIFIKPSTVPSKEKVPMVNAIEYQIKQTAIQRRSSGSFTAIWTGFRRPLPKPVVAKPKKPDLKAVVKIGPDIVKRKYKLVGVTINAQDPKRSTIFMKRTTSKNRILVKVGEPIPETPYILMALALVGESSIKAELRSKTGKTESITMRRGEKK